MATCIICYEYIIDPQKRCTKCSRPIDDFDEYAPEYHCDLCRQAKYMKVPMGKAVEWVV